MKLSEIEIGVDYATRADGQWSYPKRVRALEIGEYKTKRITGRVHRDHRGGSTGPPTETVTTTGVRLQYLYNDGSPQPMRLYSEPEWTQANQIACTWAEHLRKKEEAEVAKAQREAREEQERQNMKRILDALCDALQNNSIGFWGKVGDEYRGANVLKIVLKAEEAEKLTAVLKDRL